MYKIPRKKKFKKNFLHFFALREGTRYDVKEEKKIYMNQ